MEVEEDDLNGKIREVRGGAWQRTEEDGGGESGRSRWRLAGDGGDGGAAVRRRRRRPEAAAA